MRRNLELEATIVEKYAAVEAFLDERGRRIWAATESRAIGYGGDALVSDATGLSRPTIRSGRRELESGNVERGRIRRPGAGRPSIEQSQPGIKQALEKLVDPLTRGDPESPLRWTCKSRAKLTAALSKAGWKVSSTTVSRLLHELGYLRPRLLILDELGYLPIDKTGADLLFQIISQRYERGSLAITNRVFKHWPEIFNHDATLTSAVLDRLLVSGTNCPPSYR